MKRTVSLDPMPQTTKRFRSTPSYRKRYNAKPSTAQVRSIVQRAIFKESETKISSITNNEVYANTISPNPIVFIVPVPEQGVSSHQRIGNKIRGVGISSKLLLHNNAGNTPCWVRCTLVEVLDGQMTDTEIQNDLFEGTSDSTVGLGGSVVEVVKKYDREYYKVLKDEVIGLHGNTDPDSVKIINFYKKLNGQEMKFNDAFATRPVGTSRFVWIVYAREADGDESLGTNVEISCTFDYYFKE